jgi:hypothetical protein
MALRIFEVSTDGVATAVSKDEVRKDPPPPPNRPERWAGSTEWDKLRARIRQQEPRIEAQRRR